MRVVNQIHATSKQCELDVLGLCLNAARNPHKRRKNGRRKNTAASTLRRSHSAYSALTSVNLKLLFMLQRTFRCNQFAILNLVTRR